MATETPSTSYPDLAWNLRQLYWDVLWFGVLAGSTIAFLAVYATRLGASSFQIGLLSAGPALVNLLFTLPSGRWLEGRSLARASFRSSIWQRLGYLLMIGLPWMLDEQAQVWGMVWITLIMSVPGTLLAISFNSMFAEVVPPDWRARSVGWRNALIAISVTLTTVISGQVLDQVIFPLNYQIVFIIGGVGAMMSSFHLGRMRPVGEPMRAEEPPGEAASPGKVHRPQALRSRLGFPPFLVAEGKPLLRFDLLRGPFGLFMLAYMAFYTFQYFGLPIFPVFYVRELSLSDGMISIGTALFHGMMILASLGLNRASARLGHRKLLVVSAIAFAQFPLLLGLARDAWLYYAACMIGGGIFAFLNGALINRLMERVPVDDRPAHMALHNLGILAGSLLGPAFVDWIGPRPSLILNTVLRILAGVLLLAAG